MTDLQTWLASLKAGDAVVVIVSAYGRKSEELRTVDRVTNTQVIVGTRRYKRSTGSLIGACVGRAGGCIVPPAEAQDGWECMMAAKILQALEEPSGN